MPKRNFTREFLDVAEAELRACGLPTMEACNKFFLALAEGRTPKRESEAVNAGLSNTLAMLFRQAFARRKIRNEIELERAINQVRGIRHRLRPVLGEAVKQFMAEIPTQKRGPQPRLTATQRTSACSIIDTLVRNGSTKKYAIQVTAKDYKVTPRLMRKVWEHKGR